MKNKTTPAPLKLVKKWKQAVPNIYDDLDEIQHLKTSRAIQWPDYCELPIGATAAYMESSGKFSDFECTILASEITACWTWRRNKIVYDFDENLAAVLAEQSEDMRDTDVLPVDLFFALPFPCCYIKAPIFDGFDGFWVWIEFDLNEIRNELRIQLVSEDGKSSVPSVLHLYPGHTLKECRISTEKTISKNAGTHYSFSKTELDRVLKPLQLVLYLLSENAEIDQSDQETRTDEKQKVDHVEKEQNNADVEKIKTPKSIKDQYKEIHSNDVGVYFGAAFRSSRNSYNSEPGEKLAATGRKTRPHVRRGHWHHYWYGKAGDRKLKLKWTAPILVNANLGEIGTVIIPVK